MPKCIETACANKGTTRVLTADGQSLPICSVHLPMWIEGGATVKKSFADVAGGTLKRYGLSSGLFLAGFALMMYNVFYRLDTALFSVFNFFALTMLALSWLVNTTMLHGAYAKVRSRTLTEFGRKDKTQKK